MTPQEIVALALGEHWPLFFAVIVLWALGKLIKALTTHKRAGAWATFHRTMTWHPMLMGAALGMVPGAPVPASVSDLGAFAASLYFAGAGVIASFGVKGYRAVMAARSKEE